MQGHRYVQDPAALSQHDSRLVEARRRHRIVLYSLGLEGSWCQRTAAVAEAIRSKSEDLDGPAPSRSSLTRWVERFQDVGLRGLIDIPSTGRPRSLSAEAEEVLTSIAHRHPGIQPKRLLATASRFCRRRSIPVPGYHTVRRWLLSRPVAEVTMERYGTQATRADAMPKATYPTQAPGDLLIVDETVIPIWIRVWRSSTQEWVPATAWAVVVWDHFSRAIVSWWVKEPSEANPNFANFTSSEVLATIAGATVPELAPAFMQPLIIGDPKEIRMDGGGGIGGALRTIQAIAPDWVTRSTVRAPWTNGGIERAFRTIKERHLSEVVGWKSEWVPFSLDVDPRDTRTRRNTGTTRRVPYRHEVPVTSLPDIGQVRSLFDRVVQEFNLITSRSLRGDTPLNVYLKHVPAVSGEPSRILAFLPEHNVSLFPHGVEVDNVRYQSDELHSAFRQRTRVRVRVDPLGRGVFVYPQMITAAVASRALFVPPAIQYARTQDPAERAKRQTAVLSALRASIDADRDAHVSEAIGDEAYQALAVAKDDRAKQIRGRSRAARSIDKQNARKQEITFLADLDAAAEAVGEADGTETSLSRAEESRERTSERQGVDASGSVVEGSSELPKRQNAKTVKGSRTASSKRNSASTPARSPTGFETSWQTRPRRPLFSVRLIDPDLRPPLTENQHG